MFLGIQDSYQAIAEGFWGEGMQSLQEATWAWEAPLK